MGFKGLLAGQVGSNTGELAGSQSGGAGQAGFFGVIGSDDQAAIFRQAGQRGRQHAGDRVELTLRITRRNVAVGAVPAGRWPPECPGQWPGQSDRRP